MAITTRDGLVSAIAAGRSVAFSKVGQNIAANAFGTLWRTAGQPSGNATLPTTTGQTLSRTSQGAMPIPAPSGTSYLSSFEGVAVNSSGAFMLADRLVEFGGLSGIVTTAQTVSALALPTRASSATDVELWLEIMAAAGTTASATVTASYTNQAGTSGRTATLVGGIPASSTQVNRIYQFTLQAGDTGVQSVQSLTIGTSTGTAGNIGLVLRRTLVTASVPAVAIGFAQGWAETDLQIIPDDAAIEICYIAAGTTGGGIVGNFGIAQG